MKEKEEEEEAQIFLRKVLPGESSSFPTEIATSTMKGHPWVLHSDDFSGQEAHILNDDDGDDDDDLDSISRHILGLAYFLIHFNINPGFFSIGAAVEPAVAINQMLRKTLSL